MTAEFSGDKERLAQLAMEDKNSNEFIKLCKTLDANNRKEFMALLDSLILNRQRTLNTLAIDKYCAGLYEKYNSPRKALKILDEVLKVHIDGVAFRTFFRICRKSNNSELANDFFSNNASALMATRDFNILYELVYFFDQKQDYVQLKIILDKVREIHNKSTPIMQTLKNFYIQFGMLKELSEVTAEIGNSQKPLSKEDKKFTAQLAESELTLASSFLDLRIRLEHQNQLIAMSDLAKGIAHELGQPITNIRYTIQFYKKIFEKTLSKENVLKVFDSILEETERMGALIQRLSPLTSRKSIKEYFNIVDRINKRVRLEEPRLKDYFISVKTVPDTPVSIYGDPIRFDQIIGNLLLNAIDALRDHHTANDKQIEITVIDQVHTVTILFEDNGPGIPEKSRKKIFEPFYSTKAPGKGEGLGLFIVWNLLTIQGGSISVDETIASGTRFVLTIPKTTTNEKDAI